MILRLPYKRLLLGVGLAGVLVGLFAFASVAQADVSSAQAIAFLNQQRAANGIPSSLTEDPQLTEGCLEYDHYRALNPDDPPHHEIPGHPGYTPLGAGEYGFGYSEVNAGTDNWAATTNAWDAAPIHQSLLFDPTATTAGYAFNEGTACMRLAGFTEAAAPSFYSYTDDAGPAAVAVSETANEWPYVPQQLVGIPPEATTGPNLIAFADDFGDAHVASVSLMAAGGSPVSDIRFVDATTPGASGFFQNSVDVISAAPLQPLTSYVAIVNWQNENDQTFSQQFSFTTGAESAENSPSASHKQIHPHLKLEVRQHRGRNVAVAVRADRILIGRTLSLSISRQRRKCGYNAGPFGHRIHFCSWVRAGKAQQKQLVLTMRSTISVRAPRHGHLDVVDARTKPFKIGNQPYAAAHARLTLR